MQQGARQSRPTPADLPAWVAALAARLPDGHLATLRAVAAACGELDEHGSRWGAIGGPRLIEAAGISRATFWRALARLRALGAVVIVGGPGRIGTRHYGTVYGVPAARGALDYRRRGSVMVTTAPTGDGRRLQVRTRPGGSPPLFAPAGHLATPAGEALARGPVAPGPYPTHRPAASVAALACFRHDSPGSRATSPPAAAGRLAAGGSRSGSEVGPPEIGAGDALARHPDRPITDEAPHSGRPITDEAPHRSGEARLTGRDQKCGYHRQPAPALNCLSLDNPTRGRGGYRGGRGLTGVRRAELSSAAALAARFREAVARGLIDGSDDGLVRFLASAARARRLGGQPERFFCSFVSRGLWLYLDEIDYRCASELLNQHRDTFRPSAETDRR